MDTMKKHNTEIKHLKKELGIETKEKMKVTKKLENLEKVKGIKHKTSIKNSAKKKTDYSAEVVNSLSLTEDEVLCSICACIISNYIPEYFCGELYNPACEKCKEDDFSRLSNDPLSSFPTSSQPISLVSHWVLPFNNYLPQNPNSITSLRTHCVLIHESSDELVSLKQDFLEIFEKVRAQLQEDIFRILG